MKWLGLTMVALGGFIASLNSAAAAEPAGMDVRVRCHPTVLYRSDDLVVEFGSPHDNFDFGIWPGAARRARSSKLFLLSFAPGKNDHFPPLIPAQQFGSMRRITLNTATARGSVSNWWRGPTVARALKPPELIFTDSGSYEILLGAALGAEDAAFGACWVNYVNQEKHPGALLPDGALHGVMDNTFRQDSCRARTFERAITCPATTMYRGETLALDLDSRNPAARIGIVDPDWNIYLLPAEKNAGSDPLRATRGIKLVAGSESASAYSYESTASYGVPSKHVETRAGRVFSRSGWYIALPVPGPRCEQVTDVGACWIHYVDAAPPPK